MPGRIHCKQVKMSSDSELSGGRYASSKSGRIRPTEKNSKEKRKRGTKVDSYSSDSPSSPEVRVKKARASQKVKSANKTKSLEGNESSSEDSSAKENSDRPSSSEESTENKSVGSSSKNERTEVQQRCSDNVVDSSDDEDKASSSKLTEQKSQKGSMNTVGDSNKSNTDSDSSLPLKSSKKSDSFSTGSSDTNKQKAVHVRKKKANKEKLLSKQTKNYDSSDDEYSEKAKLSREINKSKLGKQVSEDSSAKENTDDGSLGNKEQPEHTDKKRGSAKKETSSSTVKDSSRSRDKVKDVRGPKKLAQKNKKLERTKSQTGSELSENDGPTSDSSGSAESSDLKVKKNIGKPTNQTVDSKKQMKKLPKKTLNKSSKATASEQKSCQSSSNSDSGLEGSEKEVKCRTSGKVKKNEKFNRKIECKESVSSSGSDSEPLIKKQNEKHSVEKYVSSDSSCDSEPDKQSKQTRKESPSSRLSLSDDEPKTKNVHLVSSSGSESEDGSKAAKKKEVKGKAKQKSKDEKDVSEKKTKSVEDPHKNKAVIRAKRYVKEAGLRVQNYASLWADCRSNKARAQAIIDFLHENGLSGTPTLEKCKRLRIKREKKNEASELDLANIISKGRESRRSAMLTPVRKPVENDSPTREEVKSRFARIQALGDSGSSSE